MRGNDLKADDAIDAFGEGQVDLISARIPHDLLHLIWLRRVQIAHLHRSPPRLLHGRFKFHDHQPFSLSLTRTFDILVTPLSDTSARRAEDDRNLTGRSGYVE